MLDGLVFGRSCGECTACCTELTIAEPELKKHAGVTCEHCTTGKGCAIYDERPSVCRTWHCLWRLNPNMDDSWRPDKKGLIGNIMDAPAGFNGAVKFDVIGASRVLIERSTVSLISGAVAAGMAVYIGAPGRIGMAGGKSLINYALRPALEKRDLNTAKAVIQKAYHDAKAVPQVPIDLGSKAAGR